MKPSTAVLGSIHLAVAVLVLSPSVLAAGGKPPSDEDYKLVWADEFNEPGQPDPKKWTYEHGFVRNEELQWYQSENARCEKGLLVIEARREEVRNANYEPQSRDWRRQRPHAEYTAACLKTRGLHAWQYGRFEMRGRIDVRPGLWPAFWTLGQNLPWPACGEIDIMEYYRGDLLANVAWRGERSRVTWRDTKWPLQRLGDADWPNQFHIWRMDWDPERIELWVDDRLLNTVDMAEVPADHRTGIHPFRQPHYLLLNLAIGGTNGGNPAETEFPARFGVDYVRVYQRTTPQED